MVDTRKYNIDTLKHFYFSLLVLYCLLLGVEYMKIKEKYEKLKDEKSDVVVLIKVGSFYTTFGNDALILSYLFSYQVKNDKLGFPLSALDKVLFDLKQKKIHYLVVVDDEVVDMVDGENMYFSILEVAQKFYYDKMSMNLLMERIQLLIHKDPENYLKIKGFIDEL